MIETPNGCPQFTCLPKTQNSLLSGNLPETNQLVLEIGRPVLLFCRLSFQQRANSQDSRPIRFKLILPQECQDKYK